ncbi:signal peptide peptidase SppA [Salidesulfovibrio onnuriiensis]|uniref:signal peptide peptidase SppA n=1 Tax=Salidesulfovibrio onnuriiensis TaxID=2583823 RepID=UPI0011C812FD|nr:signal peptide peptidase SppA [Salidesulfovibrio onnuriiensis]
MEAKLRFSQKHPFLFGVLLIVMAVALIAGAMAFFGLPSGGFAFSGTKLGQANVYGPIMDADPVVDWLNTLRGDDSVKGVLLRVDSPGGAIAPSQEIYQAVKRLAEVKPVVASFGTVAASGGYYVSAPATKIVANPGSVTASIGVKAEFITFGAALEKLGVKPEVLATGRFKSAGTPLKDLTEAQREQILGLMGDMQDQFVADVAAGRKMHEEEVRAIADGRAVTGKQALVYGLVDRLGGREDAIELLKELCEITDKVPLVEGPVEEKSLLEELIGIRTVELQNMLSAPGWIFSY